MDIKSKVPIKYAILHDVDKNYVNSGYAQVSDIFPGENYGSTEKYSVV